MTTILLTLLYCLPAQKVAAYGDSITAQKYGFVHELSKKCPSMKFKNLGKRGRWTGGGRRLFKKKILNKGFTQVIIMFGTNDILGGRTHKSISSDLQYMYNTAKKNNIKVIALTIPPIRRTSRKRQKELIKLNKYIRKAKNVGVVVDIYKIINKNTKGYMWGDGIHPNFKGHKVIADLIGRIFSCPAAEGGAKRKGNKK